MSLFQFLNRCLRAFVWLCWLGAAAGLWMQRDRALPLVDYFVIWRDTNWSTPAPLPRMGGRVVRVLGETMVQFRSDSGVTWNLGLQGCDTNGLPPGLEGLRLVGETRKQLGTLLEGRPVEFALTVTNASRTGLGYLYTEATNSVLDRLVTEGRCGVKAEETRVLPIGEQSRLRVEGRRGRSEGVGRWAPSTNAVAGK